MKKFILFVSIIFAFISCGPRYSSEIIKRDIDPKTLHYDLPVLSNGQMTPYVDSVYYMKISWDQALGYNKTATILFALFIFIGIGGVAVAYYFMSNIKDGNPTLTGVACVAVLALFWGIGYGFIDSYRNDNNLDHPIKKQDYIQIQQSDGDFSKFWDTIKLHR